MTHVLDPYLNRCNECCYHRCFIVEHAERTSNPNKHIKGVPLYSVVCETCGNHTDKYQYSNEALTAWNESNPVRRIPDGRAVLPE